MALGMYIDFFNEYPDKGAVYRTMVDDSKPLDEQVEEKVEILPERECDIISASSMLSKDFITDKFTVTFPIDTENGEKVEIKRGDYFEGETSQGVVFNGKVIGVAPSQLGSVTLTVQDSDV